MSNQKVKAASIETEEVNNKKVEAASIEAEEVKHTRVEAASTEGKAGKARGRWADAVDTDDEDEDENWMSHGRPPEGRRAG